MWDQANWVDGGNEVPVLGTERNDSNVRDVRLAQVLRLCVIIRILILVLTMELVATGFIVMMDDVLQWSQGNLTQRTMSTRERVVYGTAFDGGVDAVRRVFRFEY